MKVEVVCKNLSCPTRANRRELIQLLSCHGVTSKTQRPFDEDRSPVGCPWCGKAVYVDRYSRDAALFPLGEVETAEDARVVFRFGHASGDPLSWVRDAADLVARHVSGDHGSVTEEVLYKNEYIISLQPFCDLTDTIVSQYFIKNDVIWVASTPMVGVTLILGKESIERRVGIETEEG